MNCILMSVSFFSLPVEFAYENGIQIESDRNKRQHFTIFTVAVDVAVVVAVFFLI